MNLTGNLVGASRDFKSGRMRIVFEVNEAEQVMKRFDVEKEYLLDIDCTKHRVKRSLGANALFHRWVALIADNTGETKPAVKNRMLHEYGRCEINEATGEVMMLNIKDTDLKFWENNEVIHTWPVHFYVDGTVDLMVLRPSKTLDSDEFRALLNGTKAECESLGIETMSADEIAHIASLWEAEND